MKPSQPADSANFVAATVRPPFYSVISTTVLKLDQNV